MTLKYVASEQKMKLTDTRKCHKHTPQTIPKRHHKIETWGTNNQHRVRRQSSG